MIDDAMLPDMAANCLVMGNTRSQTQEEVDLWWQETPDVIPKSPETREERKNRISEELDEFKLELARKHERRRQLIADKRKEMEELREEVKRLKEENEELRNLRSLDTPNELNEIREKNLELKVTIAHLQKDLQAINTQMMDFEKEREDYKAHVVALKDVISVSKQMLLIREAQLTELKEKVKEIEQTIGDRELSTLSQDLRAEYERQLQNIRNLRNFYEERQKADRKEKEELREVLEEVRGQLEQEQKRLQEANGNVERLEEENSKKYDEIKNLESTLGLTKAECRQYEAELNVINQLFSQILLGFNNNQDMDIDKLVKHLEENHHLLQHIAVNEESNQVSALPKVLLDLVNQITEDDPSTSSTAEGQISNQVNSASEIVENLPKVWKVLIELLSHQAPISTDEPKIENPCYKVVETAKGPHLVLSVSQTFIRLKDLILEKKSLERETLRLKQLNTHLEGRLQDQEKRLELVSGELSETWHVVGKLQKRHQMLHTQEKILRYELAQKRQLLAQLKSELEDSRGMWKEARERNSHTEKQWKELRSEFAERKKSSNDDAHSAESGYSDEKESSEDEDTEKVKGEELDAKEERRLRLEGECSNLTQQMTDTPNGLEGEEEEAEL